MTAYELAQKLNDAVNKNEKHLTLDIEAMLMLRQQADRIAELEKFNKAILKKGGYPYEKSNPIAWMSPNGKVSTTEGILFHIPLYTTPQTKPLSDEEVIKIRQTTKAKSTENWADTLAFARAIEERHGIK